ncbi:phosphoadenosine phosphosulfate reductase family protein [Bacillus sp. SM2101]|uniref:phosphoadenosine phosphosulfate reductase domain-containing protein n=1 Tax=Bacillus sp. SM2101 TaxID=2805366 RepID=UPI0020325900|nr:phosphoadenosine phosphosulfate reductase family protein [Bacillus sp. SM2101]
MKTEQLGINFDVPEVTIETERDLLKRQSNQIELLPLNEYDHVIVQLSAGKDSMVVLWKLLELGVPKEKIELWHQVVDGRFEDKVELFDWPCIESYIDSVGKLYGIQTFYQWRESGIYGEMMRKNSLSGDVFYDNGSEVKRLKTTRGKKSTRLKWPAASADLRIRYCSAYVKIDVARRVLNNDPRYKGTIDNPKKILVCSGERRAESANRAKYNECEVHPSNTMSRICHTWRPVIDFSEEEIWSYYEKRRFLPAPPYLLGYNRTSCFGCIFSTADLWAICREIAPERFNHFVRLEKELNFTIDTNRIPLEQKADMGSLKRLPKDKRVSKWVQMAFSRAFKPEDLITEKFELPAGAFNGGAEGGPL